MNILSNGLLVASLAALLLLITLGCLVLFWLHIQQQHFLLLQSLRNSQEKLSDIQEKVESFTQNQDSRQNQWGMLLEKRLSVHDANHHQLLQLGHKIESLSHIMSHDSHRGAYGETQLVSILQDMFPPQLLKLQYTLSTQRRVDAALWLGPMERWLCIDAKFPLEDFHHSSTSDDSKRFKIKLKKHIKDISDRYIIPGETTEMAVLFLPAEGLFVWLHHHAIDILQYAHALHIWIASPSTLPSLLHITLSLLKDHRIDQLSHQFMKDFHTILTQVATYQITIDKLSKSLQTHQQHLWSLAQQHQTLYQTLKNIDTQHNLTNDSDS